MATTDAALAERAEELAGRTASTAIVIRRGGEVIVDVQHPPVERGAYDIMGTTVLASEGEPAIGLAFEPLADGRTRHDIASAHKSVVAMLVGCAQDRGLLTIDDLVDDHLGPGWSQSPQTEARITLHHLLTMTSGLDDRLRYAAEPGTAWHYSLGPAWHLLKRVLPAAAGQSLDDLSAAWLFRPLGLEVTTWSRRPGMTYLDGEPFEVLLTDAAELALLGELVLRRGVHDGDEVLSAAYIDRMTTPSQDLNPAYGLLWWLNRERGAVLPTSATPSTAPLLPGAPPDTVTMLGMLGQICAVVPSRGTVISRTGGASGHVDAHIGIGLVTELVELLAPGH